MPKACELKRGMVLDLDGAPFIIRNIEAKSPSQRGAVTIYKIKLNNLKTHQKRDEAYKGDDFVKLADCQRLPVQFSYIDGDVYQFMNLEDYSQYGINKEEISEDIGYLTEGLEGITALLYEGALIGIELPPTVTMEVIETTPGIRGASASARTKPAKLVTGIEVQVPEYLEQGENIKINTVTGKYMSRV
jgi:elongation factor P